MDGTIRLERELFVAVEAVAQLRGVTVTAVVEDALRAYLANEKQTSGRLPATLPVVDGKGSLPGVDLDDSAALLDWMEGSENM